MSRKGGDWGPVIAAIGAARRCLITSHVDPEGDSLGSQLALAEVLRDLGKGVAVVDADCPPEKYAFLPGVDSVRTPADVAGEAFDTAFVVDCGAIERTGAAGELIRSRGYPVVNIDHHRSNTRFGDVNHVIEDACATGFLIYQLNETLGLELSVTKATNMYAAIITDTGNFQYSNTTAEVLAVGSRLVETGLDPAQLSLCVFGARPLRALKLLGEALANLHTTLDGKLGVILLGRSAFQRVGALEADAEGVVNFAKSVKGTAAGVLLRETARGDVKVSFRSDGAVNVDAVARRFGGGGHHNASGARLQGPLDEACRQVVAAFHDALNGARPAGHG